jgi:hypothetical protein
MVTIRQNPNLDQPFKATMQPGVSTAKKKATTRRMLVPSPTSPTKGRIQERERGI